MRKAFKMKLYEGMAKEYTLRHNELWPKMRDMICEYGGSNYSIFLDEETNILYGYIELEDEAKWDKTAETEICKKWWKFMADIMETNEDYSPVCTDLEEVFHLDMDSRGVYRPVITLRLAADKVFFGPGVLMLLTELQATGTMKDACRRSELSYSKAWKILNAAEEELGYPLVQRQHGGKSGGGCLVTDQGKLLMKQYEEADKKIKAYAQNILWELWH